MGVDGLSGALLLATALALRSPWWNVTERAGRWARAVALCLSAYVVVLMAAYGFLLANDSRFGPAPSRVTASDGIASCAPAVVLAAAAFYLLAFMGSDSRSRDLGSVDPSKVTFVPLEHWSS